jgi:hypothetical protein
MSILVVICPTVARDTSSAMINEHLQMFATVRLKLVLRDALHALLLIVILYTTSLQASCPQRDHLAHREITAV